MLKSLHFSTTTNHLIPTLHPTSSTVPRFKPPLSTSSISATTTTTTNRLPLNKPPKSLSIPPPPPPPLITPLDPDPDPDPDPDLQTKALYLDSIGLDSLTLLTHPASATAISTTPLHTLQSLFHSLSSLLHFSPRQLRRLITICPDILSLSPRHLSSVSSFLLLEAHVPPSLLPHLIHRRPRLLLSSVPTRLRPTLYFLQSIGIHQVHKHAHLLSSSVEDKFIPKIQYFQDLGFGYSDSISMFRRFPSLFVYSVKHNFEPKFNYFVVEMGRDLKELKDFPQYFSFSLERRIKPRHQCCVENGVCLPLSIMLKMKEEEFKKRLDVCCDSSMPKSTSPLWCANLCDVN